MFGLFEWSFDGFEMGFIAAGYQSREFRIKGACWKICKPSMDGGRDGGRKRMKKSINEKDKEVYTRIYELPIEVLQRIFVLSGNHGLCEVNKFFYSVLRPNSFLLHEYIKERFYHDLNERLCGDKETAPCLWAVDEEIFKNSMFLHFLKGNQDLMKNVAHFGSTDQVEEMKDERARLFERNELSSAESLHLAAIKQDFPSRFYDWHEVYFENDLQEEKPIYNQFILGLSIHYEIKQPYYILENILHWFFMSGQQEYNVNHMFYAVNLVSHVSVLKNENSFDSVIPLIELLRGMYSQVTKRLFVLLLLDDDVNEDSFNRRRLRIAQKFVKKFYREEEQRRELFSEDILWDFLANVKEKSVMKFVIDNGGKPSFNVL